MFVRSAAIAACTILLSVTCTASLTAQSGSMQSGSMQGMGQTDGKKPMLSPPATANVTLAGQTVTLNYHAPSLRGRMLGGPEIVPWGQVWRTGANDATSLMTPVPLHIGKLLLPAGSYTLYTLPDKDEDKWMLIVNKQTGQWGTEYHQDQDLGRVKMDGKKTSNAQEVMSISFDDVHKDSAKMHIRWGKYDEVVKVTTP